MNKNISVSIKLIICIISFILFFNVINASETNLNSKRYILYNLNDTKVIDSKKEHERVSIASLTKMMSVIVAIENINNLDKKVTITSDMVDHIAWDVMKVGFKKGEKYTYRDLLYAAILPSAADAVNALAISISGSEKAFVKLMNDKVKELGLEDTKFANVVGLYDKNNYSSAYDVAQILIYSLKNETFKEVFTTKKYKMSNGKVLKSTLTRYNEKLKADVSFIKGSKTGFIDESGYCLASIATLSDVDYLFVSLNAKKSPMHIEDHITEYKYFDKNFGYKEVLSEGEKLFDLETKYAKESIIEIKSPITITKYLKNNFKKSDLVYEYDGIKKQTYFTPNNKLGHMRVKYNGEVLGEFDLYNSTTLHFDLLSYVKEYRYTIFEVMCVILLIIVLICVKIRKRKSFIS